MKTRRIGPLSGFRHPDREPYNPPPIDPQDLELRLAGDTERRQQIADSHARMWPRPAGGGW